MWSSLRSLISMVEWNASIFSMSNLTQYVIKIKSSIIHSHFTWHSYLSRIQSYFLFRFCLVYSSRWIKEKLAKLAVGSVCTDDGSKWSTSSIIRFRTCIYGIKISMCVCDCAWVTHQEYRISNLILRYSSQLRVWVRVAYTRFSAFANDDIAQRCQMNGKRQRYAEK